MNAEEQQRLWEWTLHEDNLFSERQSLFLVAESMLVAAYAAALETDAGSAALAIGVFGLVMTLAWGYVSRRQYGLVEFIQARARAELPEYREICAARPAAPLRSRTVVTFGLPLLVSALWIVLLVLRVL